MTPASGFASPLRMRPVHRGFQSFGGSAPWPMSPTKGWELCSVPVETADQAVLEEWLAQPTEYVRTSDRGASVTQPFDLPCPRNAVSEANWKKPSRGPGEKRNLHHFETVAAIRA